MTEIKRIRLKDDDVIEVGDTLTAANGSQSAGVAYDVAVWATVKKWNASGGKSKVERDLRPLAEGEVIREGDYYQPSDALVQVYGLVGMTWSSHLLDFVYRPVRMQSEGWRYLDMGERIPDGHEWYGGRTVSGETLWLPADRTYVGHLSGEDNSVRTPWPPREGPLELTDNSSKPFAIAETCIGTLPEEEGRELERVARDQQPEPSRSCIYCDEPNDETMGVVEVILRIPFVRRYTSAAHARCAQKASRLQTPGPEPLECQEQWGEEFEIW